MAKYSTKKGQETKCLQPQIINLNSEKLKCDAKLKTEVSQVLPHTP